MGGWQSKLIYACFFLVGFVRSGLAFASFSFPWPLFAAASFLENTFSIPAGSKHPLARLRDHTGRSLPRHILNFLNLQRNAPPDMFELLPALPHSFSNYAINHGCACNRTS